MPNKRPRSRSGLDFPSNDNLEKKSLSSTQLAELRCRLKASRQVIANLTGQLQSALRRNRVERAATFRLPLLDKDEERLRLEEGFVDRPIRVTACSGAEALERALFAYSDWLAGDGQATRFVARTAGVLALEPSGTEELPALVERLNLEKRGFISLLEPVPSALERHEIVHDLFPRLITQQLTRAIPFTTAPIFSLRFSWSRRMQSSVLSRDEVSRYLLEARGYRRPVPEEGEGVSWSDYIEQKRQSILELPPQEPSPYRLRRRLVARPIANVRPVRESGLAPFQLEQHLPALILNPAPDFRTGHLRDYRPGPLRVQKYRGQGHYEPLVPALDLYLKLERPE